MALIQTKPLGAMIGGPRGPRGLLGPVGIGVPDGGIVGQTLVKASALSQDTVWRTTALTVAGKTGDVVLDKADVGLGLVDNTADADKPVNALVSAALAAKADLNSPTFYGVVGGITRAMVGLGNVNNTSDAAKPVSLAQQAALSSKAPLANPVFTGTVSGISKDMVGLAEVDNTSDLNKPVSNAMVAALALRASLVSPTFTGTVSGISKSMVGLNLVDNTPDSDKPVSNPQQLALDVRAPTHNPVFTGIVAGISKAMVGLSLADNTADTQKPVSGPQQAALALKANTDSPVFTGIVSGIAPSMVGLDRVNNTSDAEKPVSAATASALAGKANSNNPVFTGTVGGITKVTVGLGNVDNTADSDKPVSDAVQVELMQLGVDISNRPSAASIAAMYAPKANPVFTGTVAGVTKAMVGLGAVDNTSDAAKPVSLAQQDALSLKAPIASPAFTGTVSGITKGMVGLPNVDNTADAAKPISSATAAALALRAPLISPVFTGAVGGITKVMVGLDNVDNTPDIGKPISMAVQAALDLKISGLNPVFTGTVTGITKATVGLGAVDNTADASKPVSAAQQAALNLKAPLVDPVFTGTVAGITKAMVGLGAVDNTSDAAKPVSAAQTDAIALKAPIASPTFTGIVGGITRGMVGLPNVDNTADAAKPVSNATQTALDLKASIASPTFTGIVGGITKSTVGLPDVDNTADSAKPVSVAQATALNLKANAANPVFTGTVGGISKAMVGLSNVDNTTDLQKPVSATQQAALDFKANSHNPAFTGVVSGVTKAMVGLSNVDNTADAAKPVSTAGLAALAGKISVTEKGAAGGVATLDGTGKVLTVQLPAALAGGLNYLGTWDASTNTPNLTLISPPNGSYYKVAIAGATIISGNGSWQLGDLVVYNGTNWDKIGGGSSEVASINGRTGAVVLVKADVGLGVVDNTSDLAKPVSTATGAALALKAPLNSPAFTGTITGISKAMIGLSGVDNTSDAAKPVSTATAVALSGKANASSPTFTGVVTGITKSMVGLTNVDDTSDLAKPISTAVQLALNTKLGADQQGNLVLTKASVGLGAVDNTADVDKPVSTAQNLALQNKLSLDGGSMNGPINLKGVTVASAATTPIWSLGGNQITLTGSATVTSFGSAPQVGAERNLILGGTVKFTSGFNLLIEGLAEGQTYIGTVYDKINVMALSTTQSLMTIKRFDGKAMVGGATGTGTGTGEVTFAGVETLYNKTLTNPALTRQTLISASTIGWNCALGSYADVELTSDTHIMGAPTSMKTGMYFLYVKQGPGGTPKKIASWNSVFKWINGSAPVLSLQAGEMDMFMFVSDGISMVGNIWVKGASSTGVPVPPPVTPPTDAELGAATFNFGGVAQKGAWLQPADIYLKAANGQQIVGMPADVQQWNDRSANASNLFELDTLLLPRVQLTGGVRNIVTYNNFVAAKGGSGEIGVDLTKGFFLVARLLPYSYTSMMWSDVAAVNTGRFLRWFGGGANEAIGSGDIEFSVGNGAGRISVRSVPGAIITPAAYEDPTQPLVVFVYHDPVANTLGMTVGGQTTTVPFTGTFAPGAAGYAFSGKPDLSFESNVYVFEHLHVNNRLDAALRSQWLTYFTGAPVLTPPPPPPTGSVAWAARTPYTGYVSGFIVPTNSTQAQRDEYCTSQFTYWLTTLQTDMFGKYPAFNGDPNQTVSEGIGYGMVITAHFAGYYAGAQALFNDLYNVAVTHPAWGINEPAHMEWKIDRRFNSVIGNGVLRPHSIPEGTPGGSGGGWSAFDAEEDIALGLLQAHRQWGSAGSINYLAKAIIMINAMKVRHLRPDGRIVGGPGDVSRTSDYMTGHFKAFKRATGDAFWDSAIDQCFRLLNYSQTTISPGGLMPDFLQDTQLATPRAADANLGDGNGHAARYFWNAIRVAQRMGHDFLFSGDVRARLVCERLLTFFINKHGPNPNLISGGYNMDGTEEFPNSFPTIFKNLLINGAMCVPARQDYLNAIWSGMNSQRATGYYGTELELMSGLVMAGRWIDPL